MARKQDRLQLRDIQELTQAISAGEATPEFLKGFKARQKREKSLLRQVGITRSQLADILVPRTQKELSETERQERQAESQLAPTRVRDISRREVRRTRPAATVRGEQRRESKRVQEQELQKALQEAQVTGLLAGRAGEISEAQQQVFEAERPERDSTGLGFLRSLGLVPSPITSGVTGLSNVLTSRETQQEQTQQTPEDRINEALGQGFAPEAVQDTLDQQGTVRVRSSAGKTGSIPASQLQEALNQGFTII